MTADGVVSREMATPSYQQILRRDTTPTPSAATTTAHKFTLPSTYPSSIASSWQRPERSVWFQQKAIIITSIFLAIFIVLFIGAAVFLRDRKYDYDESDEAQVERMVNERAQAGLANQEKEEVDEDGTKIKKKKKKRFRSAKRAQDKEQGSDQMARGPSSTSSSSVIKRSRHLVSRWARMPTRRTIDSRETTDLSDGMSTRSSQRPALHDPNATERVEVIYDDHSNEPDNNSGASSGGSALRATTSRPSADSQLAGESAGQSRNQGGDADSLRAPATPPPPPLLPPSSGTNAEASSSSPSASTERQSIRRRPVWDESDFQAADDAEDDGNHLPPAYISSGGASSGRNAASHDSAPSLQNALANGDVKRGIPPPAERDQDIPEDVIGAALSGDEANSTHAAGAPLESSGPSAAHLATDDKGVLGALYASVSAPGAAAADRASDQGAPAPAPAADNSPIVTTAPQASASTPSAPNLPVDDEGFEVPDQVDQAAGPSATQVKGKGKLGTSDNLLPAPPKSIEPVFSRFDEPYHREGPPGMATPTSPPPGRKSTPTETQPSEKQQEAEAELAKLVSSSPSDIINGTLAAPAFESLPAYIRRSDSPSAPSLDDHTPSAPRFD